jgi:uncharacterized membrane protein YphA (DoxX/SURF4 family)
MSTASRKPNKTTNITLWVLQILLALAFLGAGIGKLTSQPAMVEVFAHVGVGQWLRYVTGGIEIVSAILLLVPRFVPAGALLLIATMAGAVFTHLVLIGGSPVPAVVLLVLSVVVAWGRRDRLVALV